MNLSLLNGVKKYLGLDWMNSFQPDPPRLGTYEHDVPQKLFETYDQRISDTNNEPLKETIKTLKQNNGLAIVFATCSHNTMNLQIWLETIFKMNVVMVYEPSQFYEWLFRFADDADLVFVERDSFVEDAPTFKTFMLAANEVCRRCPILAFSRDFDSNSFALTEEDEPFDIALKSPLSQTSVWLAMKAATDIAQHGKQNSMSCPQSNVCAGGPHNS